MPLRHVTNGVILAENDALVRGIVQSVLVGAGLRVFPVADGIEAVLLARQFSARLVLLDIGMPRLNGLEACQAIRALPGYADVPIVMLTGYGDDRVRRAAHLMGANNFLTKPFRPDQLLSVLAIVLAPLDDSRGVRPAIDGGDDAVPGGRVQVWEIPKQPGLPRANDPQLIEWPDVTGVYRNGRLKS